MRKVFCDFNNVIEDGEPGMNIICRYSLPIDETGHRPGYVERAWNELQAQLTFVSTKHTWGQARRAYLASWKLFNQILPYLEEDIVTA